MITSRDVSAALSDDTRKRATNLSLSLFLSKYLHVQRRWIVRHTWYASLGRRLTRDGLSKVACSSATRLHVNGDVEEIPFRDVGPNGCLAEESRKATVKVYCKIWPRARNESESKRSPDRSFFPFYPMIRSHVAATASPSNRITRRSIHPWDRKIRRVILKRNTFLDSSSSRRRRGVINLDGFER